MRNDFVRVAQIETNTQCNYSCWYCPNRYFMRPIVDLMEMDLFEYILSEIRATYMKEEFNVTAFSAYNEPTLDPFLLDRIRVMTKMGFAHLCVVNGSFLNKELVDSIVEEKLNVSEFVINLPTVDKEEAVEIIGISPRFLEKVLVRIDYLFERVRVIGIPVKILVNGTGSIDHEKRYRDVCSRFACHEYKEIRMSMLVNRAGLLESIIGGKTDRGVGKELRCNMQRFDHLYFGVKGNVYLCCHDYRQVYSFGNIIETPLKKLIEGEKRKGAMEEFKKKFCRYCSESEVEG